MTRCVPRTRTSALRISSWVAPGAIQQLRRRDRCFCFGDREQQVLGRDELVFEAGGLVEGALEHLVERRGEVHSLLHAVGLGQVGEQVTGFGGDGVGMDAGLFEDRAHDAVVLLYQGNQQVERDT